MADTSPPPPPPGFELEPDAAQGEDIAPPPGFELVEDDGPGLEIDIVGGTPGAAPTAEEMAQLRGDQSSVGRDIGMGLRSVLQGTGGLIGSFGGDAFNHYLVPGDQPSYRDAASGIADRLGLPSAATPRERVMGDVGEGLTGTALTLGGGSLLNAGRSAVSSAIPTIRSRVADFLTAQPVSQLAATAAGSGASSTTRELGGGTGAQVAAGLLGGMSPGAGALVTPYLRAQGSVPAAASGLTRLALRGRDGKGVQGAIDDFSAAGTTPSVGQASGNRIPQALETMLGSVPGGAGRIAKFGNQQTEGVSSRLDQLADNLSPRDTSPMATGNTIVRGVTNMDDKTAFIPKTRAVADELYKRVDSAIPKDSRVGVDSTKKALSELNASIEGAPNVAKFFQNARIQGIEGALLEDTAGLSGVLSRKDVGEKAEALKKLLSNASKNQEASYEKLVNGVNAENARLRTLGVQGQHELPAKPAILTKKDIDSQVEKFLGAQVDNKLPYEALTKLRTLVGNEIDNYSLMDNVPRSKWKALYGALSRDMESAATTPEAKQAWNRANMYYQARIARLEAIDNVIEKSGGTERVYNAAFEGVKHGATTIRAVMQSLPAEAQREVTASFIRRMGVAKPGQQNAAGDAFSMETFLTNWANTSTDAKKVLFDRHGPEFSQNMDKIARMAQRVREGSRVFQNNSGTGRLTALIGQVSGTLSGSAALAATGNLGYAVLALVGSGANAVTANRVAAILTKPQTVAWLARNGDKPIGELAGQLQVLRQIGEREGDQSVIDAADTIEAEISGSGTAQQPPAPQR